MTEAQQIIAAIGELQDAIKASAAENIASAHDPFGDARKVRAHVATMLIQTMGGDVVSTLKKARQICEFIETGKTLEAV